MSVVWHPIIGMHVTSSLFGKGVIARVTPTGAVIRFESIAGIEIEQPLDKLQPDSDELPQQSLAVEPIHTAPSRSLLAGQFGARQALEALRFGLVPRQALEELTLGYDHLNNWIIGRLPDRHENKPQVSAILGPFGTGKSHTMAVIRHVAQREGYVTAHVEVDGKHVSLSEPGKLLYSLWGTLSGTDWHSSTPLLDLYVQASRAGHVPPSIASHRIDRIRHNYAVARHLLRTGKLDEHGYALDALLSSSEEFTASAVNQQIGGGIYEGSEQFTVKRMIGSKVLERPNDLIESLTGHAVIAQLAGYRGLIVTVDEFEVERAALTTKGYERVAWLIKVLTDYLQGNTDHRSAALGIFFATVGEASHVGDSVIEQMLAGVEGDDYELEPWPSEDLEDLAERIHTLYCRAYAVDGVFDAVIAEQVADDCSVESVGDGMIRAFIKRYVGVLDTKYGPPCA